VRPWERTYVTLAVAVDLGAALAAAGVALLVGAVAPDQSPWWVLGLAAPLTWVAAVGVAGGYERRYLGSGVEEFRRLALAALGLLAVAGTVAWVAEVSLDRAAVLVVLPLALALSGLSRYLVRRRIHRLRRRGRWGYRTLVVGPSSGVEEMARRLRRSYQHGYVIVGACVPQPESSTLDRGRVVVLGSFDTVVNDVRRHAIDTVAVVSCPEMNGERLRRLAWDLEPSGAELVVAPALIEVAGPRMEVRPVEGLPLLHVDQPSFTGGRRVLKRGLDVVLSAAALMVLLPVLAVIALAVRADSPGPVLFRQVRVGLHGRPFTIYKVRTMVVDAEHRLAEVQSRNEADGPLFKLSDDPRVTRVGRLLRRTSLDELPQLVNVLTGSMSLVGPRPHLPAEVERFGVELARRVLVKPGLTGLWQVSGRSDLSWEDSVQLDLRYIENWTLALDLYILWKTTRAVLRGWGAY
jgi:exopolysaccharide biosynthesis polyprenyl glycosylphosphotransferase